MDFDAFADAVHERIRVAESRKLRRVRLDDGVRWDYDDHHCELRSHENGYRVVLNYHDTYSRTWTYPSTGDLTNPEGLAHQIGRALDDGAYEVASSERTWVGIWIALIVVGLIGSLQGPSVDCGGGLHVGWWELPVLLGGGFLLLVLCGFVWQLAKGQPETIRETIVDGLNVVNTHYRRAPTYWTICVGLLIVMLALNHWRYDARIGDHVTVVHDRLLQTAASLTWDDCPPPDR